MAARDGWPRRRLTLPAAPAAPARGSILFLSGRGDHYEKYLEPISIWSREGWHVEAVDWRGQGGSGRLASGDIGHIDAYSRWIDDLADDWVSFEARCCAPHVIIAHSMGGHLALRALVERRVSPRAAVLLSPMLGLNNRLPNRVGSIVAQLMARWRGDDAPAWRIPAEVDGSATRRGTILTGDRQRYEDELWWRAHRPELALGAGSWRWVSEAYGSFAKLGAPGVLQAVDTPLLLLGAEADALVSATAIRNAAKELPHAQLHLSPPPAAHELLREVDAIRNDAMARIAAFLDAQTAGKAAG